MVGVVVLSPSFLCLNLSLKQHNSETHSVHIQKTAQRQPGFDSDLEKNSKQKDSKPTSTHILELSTPALVLEGEMNYGNTARMPARNARPAAERTG